uniref:Hypoxia-inducible factor alpha subunit-like domain-containing protein n=1 Tax=Neogobius melanostomus TaxID=47308 RepID=A0A8C6TXI3_9GOBI
MDTSGVERFFALWPEDMLHTDRGSDCLSLQHMDDMDLDTLAPYISMDDDFQLSVLTVPEESQLPCPNGLAPECRKRYAPPQFLSSLASEALCNGCLEEDSQPDEVLPGSGWSQLLTDKDPVLGGVQCERSGTGKSIRL